MVQVIPINSFMETEDSAHVYKGLLLSNLWTSSQYANISPVFSSKGYLEVKIGHGLL